MGSDPNLFGGKAPTPLAWNPLPTMDEYVENMVADQLSDAYITSAKLGLAHFCIYLALEGIKHPDEIERKHLLRFQTHLAALVNERTGQPLSLSYRQQLMKYLHRYFNWLEALSYIEVNPWRQIRIGSQKKVPKPLEDEEIVMLFDAHRKQAFSITPFTYHRRETILCLLYGWGLRLHELLSLTVQGMDVRQDFVSVKNKGGGTKPLPYSDLQKQIITRWVIQRSYKAVPGVDDLLIDQSGKPLNSNMVYRIVTDLGHRAGVTINPHRLRDSFGTKLLEEDVPVERIMKMMGHTQRAQTLAYARVNDKTLKSSHDAVMQPLLKKLLEGEGV